MTAAKVTLTDAEKDRLQICDCGHYASYHVYKCASDRCSCRRMRQEIVDANLQSLLAARIVEAKAEAWDEGYWEPFPGGPTHNPYRPDGESFNPHKEPPPH